MFTKVVFLAACSIHTARTARSAENDPDLAIPDDWLDDFALADDAWQPAMAFSDLEYGSGSSSNRLNAPLGSLNLDAVNIPNDMGAMFYDTTLPSQEQRTDKTPVIRFESGHLSKSYLNLQYRYAKARLPKGCIEGVSQWREMLHAGDERAIQIMADFKADHRRRTMKHHLKKALEDYPNDQEVINRVQEAGYDADVLLGKKVVDKTRWKQICRAIAYLRDEIKLSKGGTAKRRQYDYTQRRSHQKDKARQQLGEISSEADDILDLIGQIRYLFNGDAFDPILREKVARLNAWMRGNRPTFKPIVLPIDSLSSNA